MNRVFVVRLPFFVCLFMLSACADYETYTDRLDASPLLLGEFQGYSSEQAVRAALGAQPIQEVERSGLPQGDGRPRFDIVTLAVAEYHHLGVAGELRLQFFNDRLSDVWFYPDDVDEYMAALGRREVAVTTDRTGQLKGTVRIWTQRDYRNRTYVGWSDQRLDDQRARWISRYS